MQCSSGRASVPGPAVWHRPEHLASGRPPGQPTSRLPTHLCSAKSGTRLPPSSFPASDRVPYKQAGSGLGQCPAGDGLLRGSEPCRQPGQLKQQRAMQAARAAAPAPGCGSLIVQPVFLRQRVDVPAGDEELQAVETLHVGHVRVPPHQHVPAGTTTCTPRSYPPWNKYSLACPQTPDLCSSLSSHPKHRR